MMKIHIIHVKLIAQAIRAGGTMEQRNAASLIRWCYVGAWLHGQITLPDGALQMLLET